MLHNLQQLRQALRGLPHTVWVGFVLIPLGLCACDSGWTLTATSEPGPSPFISLVHVRGADLGAMTGVQYTIAPKPGSASKPVHVGYSIAALAARGYLSSGMLTVPVMGLYADYENQVSMELDRLDGRPVPFEVEITTAPYIDPSGIYSQPDILIKRPAGSSLGFSFIYIKSLIGSPIIVDTDGEIRWAAPGVSASTASAFVGDSFIIGDIVHAALYRLSLDGTLSPMSLPSNDFESFQHDIDYGPHGLLAEPDISSQGVNQIESNLIELRGGSPVQIPNHWDLAAIVSAYMASQGDDAAAFVRPGVDWFHLNSAIYDPLDDSIIISSRENFVMSLDYRTAAIKWIFGDPTKYWHSFPSLSAKALTLAPGGLYPIGQHALSITPDGLLLLFNDGTASLNQPAGQPAGQARTYSAVSAYSIDPASMTATQAWGYDADQTVYSAYCSSAYEAHDQSVLVDYAEGNHDTEAILVGLDPGHNLVFEFAYPTTLCNTSWNARPFPLDDLHIAR